MSLEPGRAPVLVPSTRWDATAWSRLPPLASTARAAAPFAQHLDFPTTAELSQLLQTQRSAFGAPLSFERQTKKSRVTALAQAYDARIFHEGRIPTRERSWHDLFNALVWVSFPRAKRAVNARQYAALAAVFAVLGKMPGARTREQDTLAMLDEGGILLVTTPPHEVALRDALSRNDQASVHALVADGLAHTLVFGHALAEHVVSSESLVRGLPLVLTVAATAFAARAASNEFPTAVDTALAAALEGSFARSATEASRSVIAIDLRPELFAPSHASPPRPLRCHPPWSRAAFRRIQRRNTKERRSEGHEAREHFSVCFAPSSLRVRFSCEPETRGSVR